MKYNLIKGDVLEEMAATPDESVDLIVTDPAYESLEPHRAIGTTTRLQDWFPIFPDSKMQEFAKECYRVLKPNTHIYVFCDQTTLEVIRPALVEAGFEWHKFIVWNKISIGMGYHYRATHELIGFASKGKRALRNKGVPDVLSVKKVTKPKTDPTRYPTEKPVELVRILIENSSVPGEHVFDPFMGSGSTGVAALEADRSFTGIDIEERACKLASERLSLFKVENLAG